VKALTTNVMTVMFGEREFRSQSPNDSEVAISCDPDPNRVFENREAGGEISKEKTPLSLFRNQYQVAEVPFDHTKGRLGAADYQRPYCYIADGLEWRCNVLRASHMRLQLGVNSPVPLGCLTFRDSFNRRFDEADPLLRLGLRTGRRLLRSLPHLDFVAADALPQRVHQVDDVATLRLRPFVLRHR
jgi:hypothetical protein